MFGRMPKHCHDSSLMSFERRTSFASSCSNPTSWPSYETQRRQQQQPAGNASLFTISTPRSNLSANRMADGGKQTRWLRRKRSETRRVKNHRKFSCNWTCSTPRYYNNYWVAGMRGSLVLVTDTLGQLINDLWQNCCQLRQWNPSNYCISKALCVCVCVCRDLVLLDFRIY